MTCAPVFNETLRAPKGGETFTDGRIPVTGRVEDDQQIASVQVAVRNAAGSVHELLRYVHQHQRELAHGVPELARIAWLELLVHHAGHSGRAVHGSGARRRPARVHHEPARSTQRSR